MCTLPPCRPTHLLESHVSGQMVKKEVTEEGEVGKDCSRTVFLKAEIMRSHNYARYLRICANFGLMNAKQDKLALISCIGNNLTKFIEFHMF